MPRGFDEGPRGYSSYDSRFPGSHNVDYSRPSTRGGDYQTYDPMSSSGRDNGGYSTHTVEPSSSSRYDPTPRLPVSTHRDSDRYSDRRYTAGLGQDDPYSRAIHAENTASRARYGRTNSDAYRLPSHTGRGSSRYGSGLDPVGENPTSSFRPPSPPIFRPTTTSRRDLFPSMDMPSSRRDMFPSMDMPSSSSRHGSSARQYDFEPTRDDYPAQPESSSSRRSSSRHGSSSGWRFF